MRELFHTVDILLRGGFTGASTLRSGSVPLRAGRSVIAALALGGIYGVFMGLYAATSGEGFHPAPILADVFKVPLLFLLTLAVTAPSLYVVSALARSPLRLVEMLRLILAAIVVNLALLASLGPVTAFFTLSSDSYPFMVLLNVLFFAGSGLVGVVFLRRAVGAMFAPDEAAEATAAPEAGQTARRAPQRRGPESRIFAAWAVIYSVVGAQMAWILRPFIGTPAEPFTLFRERESNFFEAVLRSIRLLFE